MTSYLLGVPGSSDDREPGTVRALATVKYADDPRGEHVQIEHDAGREDRVLPAALRYDPTVHHYGHRSDFAAEIVNVLERAGYRTIGPFTWSEDAAHVRIELAR